MGTRVRKLTPIEEQVKRLARAMIHDETDLPKARTAFLNQLKDTQASESYAKLDHALILFEDARGEHEQAEARKKLARCRKIPPTLDLFAKKADGRPVVRAYSLGLKGDKIVEDVIAMSDPDVNSHMSSMNKVADAVLGPDGHPLDKAEVWQNTVSILVGGRGDNIIIGIRADKMIAPDERREKNRRAT